MLRKTSRWKGDLFCCEIGKYKTIITLIGVSKGMREQTKSSNESDTEQNEQQTE